MYVTRKTRVTVNFWCLALCSAYFSKARHPHASKQLYSKLGFYEIRRCLEQAEAAGAAQNTGCGTVYSTCSVSRDDPYRVLRLGLSYESAYKLILCHISSLLVLCCVLTGGRATHRTEELTHDSIKGCCADVCGLGIVYAPVADACKSHRSS